MMRWRRDALGTGTGGEAADAAVGRGMAEVLAVLDNVIDDDAALRHVYARLGQTVPGPAITTTREGRQAASRRPVLRAVTGVVAAAASVAVALVAAGAFGAGRGHAAGPAVSTAYVVTRIDRALSTAGPGAIAQISVTTRSVGQTTTAQEWSYGDRWRSVTDSPSGLPAYDEGVSGGSVYTVVSYPARTWARRHESGHAPPALGPPGCGPVISALPLFASGLPVIDTPAGLQPSAVAGDLRAAISCGVLAEAGRQRVDGIEAITLTSRPGSPIPETIWVSPGNYLPVRVVVGSAPGTQGPWQTADITWLAPTAQNLAKLAVPVPAGFRQVALGPILQHIRAWSAQKAESAP